ncbi:hypothetical protein B0J17DRAFT_357745 [Rhizoctonia solani]|nr:hypothetical protein B0J17DRAFT_357745 [Rhizoctonia solani]
MNSNNRLHTALRSLWSVLHVSGASKLITTLHASFPDYMLDQFHSKSYHYNPLVRNRIIALRWFEYLKDKRPQFNICKLESSYVLDDKVAQLEVRVQNAISTELYYPARYWAIHLSSAISTPDLTHGLEEFLSVRLLLWMEVMSLKKCTYTLPEIIRLIEKWNTPSLVDCPNVTRLMLSPRNTRMTYGRLFTMLGDLLRPSPLVRCPKVPLIYIRPCSLYGPNPALLLGLRLDGHKE